MFVRQWLLTRLNWHFKQSDVISADRYLPPFSRVLERDVLTVVLTNCASPFENRLNERWLRMSATLREDDL